MATDTVTVETLQRLVDAFNLFEFRGDKIARKDSYWKLVER
jgi:hypothetical protein